MMKTESQNQQEVAPFQEKMFKGVRIQDPGFDNVVFKAMLPLARYIDRIKGTQVQGELPRDGAALVFANHTDGFDLFVMNMLAINIGRTMRLVGRDSLFNPGIPESVDVLIRTKPRDWLLKRGITPASYFRPGDEYLEESEKGEIIIHQAEDIFGAYKEPENESAYLAFRPESAFFKEKIAFKGKVVAGKALEKVGNPIKVSRGKPDIKLFREVKNALEHDQLVAMFLQETRSDQDDLSNIMPGPAAMMRMHPDTPVVLVGMVNTGLPKGKKKEYFFNTNVNIADPFTYNELRNGSDLSNEEITDRIRMKMANLLLPHVPILRLL